MNKIILVCYLRLEDMPPVISLLKYLSKENIVEYVGLNDYSDKYRKMFGSNVTFKKVKIKTYKNKLLNKINKKRVFYSTSKYIEKKINQGYKLWVLHEFTSRRISDFIYKRYSYYLTMYELDPSLFLPTDNRLKKIVRRAKKVIVPEYNRAAIVQACIGLEGMPYILPNKPYNYIENEIKLANNPMESLSEQAHSHGKKVIIYSGIFLKERKLEPILEAVKSIQSKYVVVLLGQKSPYLEKLLNKYSFVKYLGFVEPPKHLDLIKYADIGLLTYVASNGSINAVYCAPNKTWEYARYGIPMLCNDIPGLRYSVEGNHMGKCCNISNIDSIIESLNLIIENYNIMSKNARNYYNSNNIERIIDQIIKD